MNMRDYYLEASERGDTREATKRAWENADACFALGDAESGWNWERVATGDARVERRTA